MCIFAFFQASECQERDPDSKTKDSPERKIFTTKRKKSAHEKKISTHERKISTHERKMISAPEREISTHERKMISAPERKISAPERKVCASITLPSPQERRPLEQYQLRYQEQQCQDIDERLESDYDQLEQQRVDFCTYPRGEDHTNDIDFREESYHEYVNNLPEEQFELEETGSRYTIEKLPGQLQVIIFILTSFKITVVVIVFFVIQVIRLYDELSWVELSWVELSWVEFVIVIVFVIQVTRLYDKFEHNLLLLLLLLLLFTVIAIQVTRLYDEFQNNWDFFPTPHLVISIEEQWNSCQIFGVSFYKLYKSRG